MPRALSAAAAARLVKRFAEKDFPDAVRLPMKAQAKQTGKEIREAFKKSSLGRNIWGRRRRGKSTRKAPLTIRRRGPRRRRASSGGGFAMEWTLKGMTALIEKGGQTRRHTIRPVAGGYISWAEGSAYREVTHPGGRVHRDPILRKAIKLMRRPLQRLIDRALVDRVRNRGLD